MTVRRIPYGGEADDWGAADGQVCHDCGTAPGDLHRDGCDVERCPICEGQLIGCDHTDVVLAQ